MSSKNMLICIEDNHCYLLLILLVAYFYRFFLFKKCVLFLFKSSGNICIIEKKMTIDHKTHELKEQLTEVLNVARPDAKENVTVYITDPKFYECFFLRGEEGLGEAFVNEYFETEELEDLLQIVDNVLKWTVYKKWLTFYAKAEECFYKRFCMTRPVFSLESNGLPEGTVFNDKITGDEWKGNIVLHNGLYDFNNTFIQKLIPDIFDYNEMEKMVHSNGMKIEHLERKPKYLSLETDSKDRVYYYYICCLRFLLKNDYISVNYLFCKK